MILGKLLISLSGNFLTYKMRKTVCLPKCHCHEITCHLESGICYFLPLPCISIWVCIVDTQKVSSFFIFYFPTCTTRGLPQNSVRPGGSCWEREGFPQHRSLPIYNMMSHVWLLRSMLHLYSAEHQIWSQWGTLCAFTSALKLCRHSGWWDALLSLRVERASTRV